MCVDLHYPTMRFVGKQLSDEDLGLDVEVFYPNVAKEKWERTSTIKSKFKDGWEVTKDIKRQAPRRGGKTRGMASGGSAVHRKGRPEGTWLIDDVYVDPRMK